MKTWLIAVALAILAPLVGAQKAAAPGAPVSAATAPAAATQINPNPVALASGGAQGLQPAPAEPARSQKDLELAVARIDGKLPSAWWLTPLSTLASVVLGGLITGFVDAH